MRNFHTDLRYGVRALSKSPTFTITVIFLLALTIGANSTVFSVVDAVLLRALPYRAPDRIVMIWEKNPALGAFIGDRVPTAPANFWEWVKRATQFEAIGGFEDANLNLTGSAEPERLAGARASANFFEVLGVQPARGTTLASATNPERANIVVLSGPFLQKHYGGGDVLGRTITLNDVVYTIVGILPDDFHLPASREGAEQRKPDLWIPYDGTEKTNDVEFHRRKMQVFGRLRDGVSLAQARAEMDNIAQQLAKEDPTLNAGFGANVFPVYIEDVGRELRRNLLILLGAIGFVLLIACANVGNLMLSRALGRQKEMAIRKALGAGRGQLISQLLAESVLLGLGGAILGLGLAYAGIKGVVALKPAGINRPEDIHLNLMVVLFTTGLALIAAMIFGIGPALRGARTEANAALNQARGGGSAVSFHARRFLIVAEVALACVLLTGAGFMIKSLVAVWKVDPGFRPDHLLTMKFSLPPSRYTNNEQIALFCRQVLEKVLTTDGVKAASFSDGLPLTRIRMTKFTVENQPEPSRGSEPTADMRGIFNPAYFETVGIPLIAGRNFTDEELDTKRPFVVVNQTLARKLWPNENAVGQHIRSVPSKAAPTPVVSTVIGVVGDTHQLSIEEGTRPEVTKPMLDYTQLTLAVRSRENTDAVLSRIKNQVWAVDRYLPIFEVHTMKEVIDETTSQRRFESFLMSIFAGMALVLSSVGIYGVLSSLVTQRVPEIGIRMALGAQARHVLKMVLSEGFRWVALGMVLGLAGGIALSRFLSSVFFGVDVASPVTYLEISALFIGIAALACYLPAARATRVNPMVALRYE